MGHVRLSPMTPSAPNQGSQRSAKSSPPMTCVHFCCLTVVWPRRLLDAGARSHTHTHTHTHTHGESGLYVATVQPREAGPAARFWGI